MGTNWTAGFRVSQCPVSIRPCSWKVESYLSVHRWGRDRAYNPDFKWCWMSTTFNKDFYSLTNYIITVGRPFYISVIEQGWRTFSASGCPNRLACNFGHRFITVGIEPRSDLKKKHPPGCDFNVDVVVIHLGTFSNSLVFWLIREDFKKQLNEKHHPASLYFGFRNTKPAARMSHAHTSLFLCM